MLRPSNGEASSGNGVTIGFAAASEADVGAFHAADLSAGGVDAGAPGARDHLPGAYAAYLIDPAGNKVCSYYFNDVALIAVGNRLGLKDRGGCDLLVAHRRGGRSRGRSLSIVPNMPIAKAGSHASNFDVIEADPIVDCTYLGGLAL